MMASLIVVLTVVTSLFFSSRVQGACPDGWQHFNESCYSFVRTESTWLTAQANCIQHGSRLVKVETQQEDEYIRNYLLANGRYFYGTDLWMGGRSNGHGGWDWSDGSSLLPSHFQAWNGGHRPATSDPSKCLEFEADYTYRWNQDFCDDLSYSVCERPFAPMTPPPLVTTTAPPATTTTTTTTPTDGLVG